MMRQCQPIVNHAPRCAQGSLFSPVAGDGRDLSSPRELLLDQFVQPTTDRLVIEALDDLVQEAANYQPLSGRCRNATSAKIEQFIGVDLAGSGAMGAAHVVGEDLKAGHGIGLGVVT